LNDTVLVTLGHPLAVQVKLGAFAAPGTRVSWSILSGPDGSALAAESSTDANGVAAVPFTLGPREGEYVIEASLPGAVQSPIPFTVSARQGKAFALRPISGNNQVGVRGTALRQSFWVGLFDRHGNEFLPFQWHILTEAGPMAVAGDGPFMRLTLTEQLGPQLVRASLTNDPTIQAATFTAFAVDAVVEVGHTDVGDCHTGFDPVTSRLQSGVRLGGDGCHAMPMGTEMVCSMTSHSRMIRLLP
jgi:hypothetical protein